MATATATTSPVAIAMIATAVTHLATGRGNRVHPLGHIRLEVSEFGVGFLLGERPISDVLSEVIGGLGDHLINDGLRLNTVRRGDVSERVAGGELAAKRLSVDPEQAEHLIGDAFAAGPTGTITIMISPMTSDNRDLLEPSGDLGLNIDQLCVGLVLSERPISHMLGEVCLNVCD